MSASGLVVDAGVVMTTAPDMEAASAIAVRLTSAKLAACVQLQSVTSVYRWRGAVETSDEALLIIKTRASLFDAVAAEIRAGHAYETPELLMTPATAIDPEYHDWLLHETREA
jgi:periplasmic divalent cation tolerance protein